MRAGALFVAGFFLGSAGIDPAAAAQPEFHPDAVVAADGSGQYRTVRAAISACPKLVASDGRRWRILVKPGTYKELLYVERQRRFISLIGEDPETTVLTYNLNEEFKDPNGLKMQCYRTASLFLDADDFAIENITIENSAGPKTNAYAISVNGDRGVFRNCRFLGFGDTVYLDRGRHYFEDCTIVGQGDFIFGGATAFFERCHIVCNGNGCITAPSTPNDQRYGFVFSHCRITASAPGIKTYLGRPWDNYAEAVFLHTEMSEVVWPAGWEKWLAPAPTGQRTARFAEFDSTGPGAPRAGQRVPWAQELTAEEADQYTMARVLAGADGWTPEGPSRPAATGLSFELSFSQEASATPLDGRMLLLISKAKGTVAHIAIGHSVETQQVFGVDVDGLAPGAAAVIDAADDEGYPLTSIKDIPPGDYSVQGFLNIYETFHMASGHTLKLPPGDRGEGQRWQEKPGNLFSIPRRIHIDPLAAGVVRIVLSNKVPPVPPPPADTQYLKHFWMESPLLTKFWGRPTKIGAHILLPEGWREHPDARYPLLVAELHYTSTLAWPVDFRTQPPSPDLKGPERLRAEYSYKFYQDWTSGRLPHMIIVDPVHPNPYYDDSYSVNSANLGPYGDAITQELIPEIERRFRAIGQPWARVVYGGSTGGWEAMAMQVFYPDFFNGAWIFCPDPIDFRSFASPDLNIYRDRNAYWNEGPWLRLPRPTLRNPDDVILATVESWNRAELAEGTHLRSGGQYAIWEAAWGPVGADGYPRPLFDIRTGVIDPVVAAYWREHYDLSDILRRNWKTLGPKLVGKLHFTVGTRDNYYLDGPVRLIQPFLEGTNYPYYAGDFEYGPHLPHGFWGDASIRQSSQLLNTPMSLLTTYQRLMPVWQKRMETSAPPGADLNSWKY